jgi:hypothetical protein
MAKRLQAGREAFEQAVAFIAGNASSNPNVAFAGSVPYLMMSGNLMAGWQLGRALLAALDELAQGHDADFMRAKIQTAHVYAEHILTKVPGIRDSILAGGDSVIGMALEAF